MTKRVFFAPFRFLGASILFLVLVSRLSAVAHAQAPVWTDAGRPTRTALEAVQLLENAGADGLNPASYRAVELRGVADRLLSTGADDAESSRFEAELTAAMRRYLSDVHIGRVDPRQIGFRLDVPDDRHDFLALVEDAARSGSLGRLIDEFRPPYLQYRQLIAALREYRQRAAGGPDVAVPDSAPPLRPGELLREATGIRSRLAQLGDLSADTPTGDGPFAGDIVDAMIRFQRRHGLIPDGIVGVGTLAALRVPLAQRVRQIELALERLRWLPHQEHRRLLVINIPMFQLWAWDRSPRDAAPVFETGVIVGRALNTQTPVLAKAMREVNFRPYWNVPRSIVVNEVRPAVAANPEYLLDNDMELVEGEGDNSPVVDASPENLERLWRGEVRVRQRPGPRNALGLVKFVFPNDENVYLHGTPAQTLFSRARRDFSHGCVRVQDTVALAEWVLGSEGGWPRERIQGAMADTRSLRVQLSEPIDVLLFYTTAVAAREGSVRFADDIYRHDARLDRALEASATVP